MRRKSFGKSMIAFPRARAKRVAELVYFSPTLLKGSCSTTYPSAMDYVFSGTVINITSIRSPRDSPGSVGLVVEQAASPDMPTKQVSSLEHLGVWDNVVSPAFQFGAVAGQS